MLKIFISLLLIQGIFGRGGLNGISEQDAVEVGKLWDKFIARVFPVGDKSFMFGDNFSESELSICDILDRQTLTEIKNKVAQVGIEGKLIRIFNVVVDEMNSQDSPICNDLKVGVNPAVLKINQALNENPIAGPVLRMFLSAAIKEAIKGVKAVDLSAMLCWIKKYGKQITMIKGLGSLAKDIINSKYKSLLVKLMFAVKGKPTGRRTSKVKPVDNCPLSDQPSDNSLGKAVFDEIMALIEKFEGNL